MNEDIRKQLDTTVKEIQEGKKDLTVIIKLDGSLIRHKSIEEVAEAFDIEIKAIRMLAMDIIKKVKK